MLKLQYKTSFIFLFTPLNRYRDSTESNKWENAAGEILRNLRRLCQYGPRCYHIKKNIKKQPSHFAGLTGITFFTSVSTIFIYRLKLS